MSSQRAGDINLGVKPGIEYPDAINFTVDEGS
jgi:hypothetical protein